MHNVKNELPNPQTTQAGADYYQQLQIAQDELLTEVGNISPEVLCESLETIYHGFVLSDAEIYPKDKNALGNIHQIIDIFRKFPKK